MIVDRCTFAVKPGRAQDAVDMIKEVWGWLALPNVHRIYQPSIGRFDVVIQEIEFRDLGEYQEFWADLQARPEFPGFLQRWIKTVDSGGSREILRVIE
jgi:hypothetical protein